MQGHILETVRVFDRPAISYFLRLAFFFGFDGLSFAILRNKSSNCDFGVCVFTLLASNLPLFYGYQMVIIMPRKKQAQKFF